MKRLACAHATALTLMELLVVLAIIGIIMMMALPKFDALFGTVRSEEAKQQLTHLFTLQKTHFFRTAEYTTDFRKISFEQDQLSTEGGAANYLVEIVEATATTYLAQATAVKDFNGNGVYNVWTIDHERNLIEVTPD